MTHLTLKCVSCVHRVFRADSPNSHILRALLNQSYETYEITGPQMVLTMKLTTFAWNVYDGRRPKEVGFNIVLEDIDLTSDKGTRQVSGAEAG